MNHSTKGIVLKSTRYGETSLIVSIFTELFGLQQYILNGVRSSSKKGPGKANLFQPAAQLDLIVYHNDLKNLQRIKESQWAYLYNEIFFDVFKSAVATYMVELLQKCLKQPEANPDLFYFMEDSLQHLDRATPHEVANFPIFFAVHLANFFGFRIPDEYSEENNLLDLQEGVFTSHPPEHYHFLEGELSAVTSQFLKVLQPHELNQIRLNVAVRRQLLRSMETFYALHVPDFGNLRSLQVLQEVLSS